MKTIIPILILTIIFASCQNEDKVVNEEFGQIEKELVDALTELGSEKEIFKINPQRANTIVGKNGTTLILPKNSIVNKKGEIVKDEIMIELKENFQIQDFIVSNLQTIHNGEILESRGMIYFQAKDEEGNKLEIVPNKSIRIQIPQKDFNQKAEIFLGQRDEQGQMNWNTQDEFAKTLIPYPIKFISKNRFPTECSDYFGITTDTIGKSYYTHYGNLTDYENTLIATKEFADRYHSTCWDSVVHIYVNKLDLNLWEADELVLKYFIRDSIRRVNYQLNYVPPNPNGGERTKQQKEAHQWLVDNEKKWTSRNIQLYKYFSNQKLTKVDATKLIDTTNISEINEVFVSYDALEFGWVNVDFFYENPNSERIKLIAKTDKKVPIVNLIFKDRMVILNGTERNNLHYYFTKEEDGYNKLPRGEKAIIMAMGLEGNSIIFDDKEITIGESEVYELNLKKINGNELKGKIKNYGS